MFDIKTTIEASELVTLSDVKAHLYITHSDDDTYLTALIPKARKQIENYCTVAIGSQTKVWTFDGDGICEYQIPFHPIISITSVAQKTDIATYTALVSNTDYEIDGQLFQTIKPFSSGRFKVTYVCGYVTLPEDLKQSILVQVAYLYENRAENVNGLCKMAKEIARNYKDYSWL